MPIVGAGAEFVALAPADPEAVLDETARAHAARVAGAIWHVPYWATPWASGIAVAEAVVAEPHAFLGRRVLELGCGLGITAMALAGAGAELFVADCWPETLAYCRFNALRYAGDRATVSPRLADWRTQAGRERLMRSGPFDVVVAADVLYEAEDVDPLRELLPRLLRPEGSAWVAEPGRTTSRRFVDATDDAGWERRTIAVTRDPWPVDAGRATVRLHRYYGIGRPGTSTPTC